MELSDFDAGGRVSSFNARRWLAALGVIAALVGIWLLASWFNHRRYHLVVNAQEARVYRGAWLPLGRRPFVPESPALAAAYVPIQLPEGFPTAVGEHVFVDRVRLDQALERLLFDAARFALEPDPSAAPGRAPRDLDLGGSLLDQRRHLPGISSMQREEGQELEQIRAYFLGRRAVRAAREHLARARVQLEMAARSKEAPSDVDDWFRRAREALSALDGTESSPASRASVSSDDPRAAQEPNDEAGAAASDPEGEGPSPTSTSTASTSTGSQKKTALPDRTATTSSSSPAASPETF